MQRQSYLCAYRSLAAGLNAPGWQTHAASAMSWLPCVARALARPSRASVRRKPDIGCLSPRLRFGTTSWPSMIPSVSTSCPASSSEGCRFTLPVQLEPRFLFGFFCACGKNKFQVSFFIFLRPMVVDTERGARGKKSKNRK